MRFLTIGLGHCGGKIASTFKASAMKEQHLIMDVCGINTDKTDLASHREIPEENKLLIGSGKGAAKDWNEGFHAGSEARNKIHNMIRKVLHPETDVVLLTLGEGGGSGSGLAPIVAEVVGDLGRDCMVLATLPFQMESVKSKVNAAKGLDLLYREETVKALILIDNDKIVAHYPDKVLTDAYSEVNKTAIETFVSLLKLANTPSQADRIDESELLSVFSYPGSKYIRSITEPFTDEMVFDAQRVKNWLDLLKLDLYGMSGEEKLHASGHANGNQIFEMLKEISPKTILPIHTENPQWFKNKYPNTQLIQKEQTVIL